jgi:hypothetical protein
MHPGAPRAACRFTFADASPAGWRGVELQHQAREPDASKSTQSDFHRNRSKVTRRGVLQVDGVALRLELETAIGAAAYPHALPLLRLTQEGAPGAEWELAVLCRELYELVRRVDGGPAAHDLAVFLNNDGADARARARAALASVPAPPAPAPAAATGGGGGRRGGAEEPAIREQGASVASGASTAGGGGQDSPARRNRGGGAARPDAGPPRGKGVSERLAKEAAASFGAGDMLAGRKRLPAWGKREEVVAAVSGTAVVVISGETGCGKTTQVPQFILDDLIARGRGGDANIVCTQPRRISAVGVAERVARERAEKIGGMVGYSIRLENKRSEHTRLLFCTTGILLRRMASDPTLAAVSHVIVDEASPPAAPPARGPRRQRPPRRASDGPACDPRRCTSARSTATSC